MKAHPSGGQPYDQSQIFAEEGTSLHNEALKATAILAKTTSADISELKKKPPQSTTWSKLFQQSVNGSAILSTQETTFLKHLLMNLAKTNPNTSLKTFQSPEAGKLRPTLITTLWHSAQQLCGSQFSSIKTSPTSVTTLADTKTPKTAPVPKTQATNLKQTTLLPPTAGNPYHKPAPAPIVLPVKKSSTSLPDRKHRERYDMKINIDPSESNPVVGFVKRIKEWFDTIKSFDPSIAILPWFRHKGHRPILSPNDIPSEMKHLRHYFNRLSPKSGIIWTKVHIILDQDPTDITSGPSTQLGWWYRDNDEGLYLRPLRDAESTQDLGILAYTCNFTNAAHTMDLINKAMAELGCKFKIGGKLRPIKSFHITDKIRATHRENGGMWQTQYWFALHLISDVSHQRTAIRYLYRLFNQKNSTQPGGLRARFIPNEGIITMSSTASGKRFKMLKKHKAVIRSLHIIKIDSIISLDEINYDTNFTLRKYLSTIQHSMTKRPLFHSVDFSASYLDEGTNNVILTAHQEHLEEASSLASVLPALCKQKLHPSTSEWFTHESQEYCEGVKFEKNTHKFSSKEDQLFDELLDEDFGTTATIQFESLPDDLAKSPQSDSLKDDGSFVSFGTMLDAKKHQRSTPSTSTDSISSPTFPSESFNEQQAESLAASNAENESLRQQIQSLLLEKAKWEESNKPISPPNSPRHNSASYSSTFQPLSPASDRSKETRQVDE